MGTSVELTKRMVIGIGDKVKTRYKFMGRDGKQYVWQSTTRLPNDSRVEEIRCGVEWFWNQAKSGAPGRALVVN
jgi:hypothetical protein